MSRCHRIQATLVASSILAALSLPAFAQRVPVNYTVITFRKAAPDKVDAFLAFTREQNKKFAQARMELGGIKSWSLLKLTMPYAMGSDHNYAIITSSDKFPDLDPDTAAMDAVFQKAGLVRAEYLKKSRELSTAVSQQITRTFLRVGTPAAAGNYVRVDYHSVPADRAMEVNELEETVWAPLHKAAIETGKGLLSWSLSRPVHPAIIEAGYSFYTAQVFKDSASVGAGSGLSEAIFKQVFPNRNYMNTMTRLRGVDVIQKVRIYHVLDTLGAPVMATN